MELRAGRPIARRIGDPRSRIRRREARRRSARSTRQRHSPSWTSGCRAAGWRSRMGGPSFRPTNPQEILVVTQPEPDGRRGIYVYDLATGGIRTIVEPAGVRARCRVAPRRGAHQLRPDGRVTARVVAADGSGDRACDGLARSATNRSARGPTTGPGSSSTAHGRASTGRPGGRRQHQWRRGARRAGLRPGRRTSSAQGHWIWSPDDSMLVGTRHTHERTRRTYLQADPDTGQVTELDWDELDRGDDRPGSASPRDSGDHLLEPPDDRECWGARQ